MKLKKPGLLKRKNISAKNLNQRLILGVIAMLLVASAIGYLYSQNSKNVTADCGQVTQEAQALLTDSNHAQAYEKLKPYIDVCSATPSDTEYKDNTKTDYVVNAFLFSEAAAKAAYLSGDRVTGMNLAKQAIDISGKFEPAHSTKIDNIITALVTLNNIVNDEYRPAPKLQRPPQ